MIIQLPEYLRADRKVKHGFKVIVQMPLKHWQPCGIDYLSRKPFSAFVLTV